MFKGIDVSRHQGKIDWEKVKNTGIEFAILRAGYGKNAIDSEFYRNVSECNRLGIPCGVYWFSYALNVEMAAQEALYCLEAIKPYKIEYPVYYDLEYDTLEWAKKNNVSINKQLATKMVEAFCGQVEKAGYYAGNYSNLDYLKNMFDESLLEKYDLWYARYATSCDRNVNLWQHTSSGKVDGIKGNVDMNVAYKNYPEIIKKAGLNRLGAAEKEGVTDKVLKYKDKGEEVKKLQRLLNLDGHGLTVDGSFGLGTLSAVKAFQKKYKLKIDGVVGQQTNTMLLQIEKRPYRITKHDKQTVYVSFKKSDVSKLDVLNSKTAFETVRSMYSRLKPKPTLIFNGGLYNMKNGDSVSKFIDEGAKITEGYTSKYGLNIDEGGTIRIGLESPLTKDFLGASPTLVINGFKHVDRKGLDDAFLTTAHPRTAFVESQSEYHIVIAHGRKSWLGHKGMSINQLVDFCLLQLNAINAINLDGGGSCMLVDETGTPINQPLENRAIDNAVCVYLRG